MAGEGFSATFISSAHSQTVSSQGYKTFFLVSNDEAN
jgi:hypothetical protein